jgi:hypothetical protein
VTENKTREYYGKGEVLTGVQEKLHGEERLVLSVNIIRIVRSREMR